MILEPEQDSTDLPPCGPFGEPQHDDAPPSWTRHLTSKQMWEAWRNGDF